jgi:hypothetical protein
LKEILGHARRKLRADSTLRGGCHEICAIGFWSLGGPGVWLLVEALSHDTAG